jgi:hypothetical protein
MPKPPQIQSIRIPWGVVKNIDIYIALWTKGIRISNGGDNMPTGILENALTDAKCSQG